MLPRRVSFSSHREESIARSRLQAVPYTARKQQQQKEVGVSGSKSCLGRTEEDVCREKLGHALCRICSFNLPVVHLSVSPVIHPRMGHEDKSQHARKLCTNVRIAEHRRAFLSRSTRCLPSPHLQFSTPVPPIRGTTTVQLTRTRYQPRPTIRRNRVVKHEGTQT